MAAEELEPEARRGVIRDPLALLCFRAIRQASFSGEAVRIMTIARRVGGDDAGAEGHRFSMAYWATLPEPDNGDPRLSEGLAAMANMASTK